MLETRTSISSKSDSDLSTLQLSDPFDNQTISYHKCDQNNPLCCGIGSVLLVENISQHSTSDPIMPTHISCHDNHQHGDEIHGITYHHNDANKSQHSKCHSQHSTVGIQQQVLKSLHQSFTMIQSAQQQTHFSQAVGRDTAARWNPCISWSSLRLKSTAYGVLSSLMVLIVRLYLDSRVHTAYLIHSIVIFFDMILIHIFTNCPWLSIGGEFVTYIHVLIFHFTRETLFELMETTLIAMLCSFHLIISRNKHYDHANQLVHNIEDLQMTSINLLQHMESLNDVKCGGQINSSGELSIPENSKKRCTSNRDIEQQDSDHFSCEVIKESTSMEYDKNTASTNDDKQTYLLSHRYTQISCKKCLKMCGEHFYEHFLDGSAGVMYTSFLGLIISELVTYGKKDKLC